MFCYIFLQFLKFGQNVSGNHHNGLEGSSYPSIIARTGCFVKEKWTVARLDSLGLSYLKVHLVMPDDIFSILLFVVNLVDYHFLASNPIAKVENLFYFSILSNNLWMPPSILLLLIALSVFFAFLHQKFQVLVRKFQVLQLFL